MLPFQTIGSCSCPFRQVSWIFRVNWSVTRYNAPGSIYSCSTGIRSLSISRLRVDDDKIRGLRRVGWEPAVSSPKKTDGATGARETDSHVFGKRCDLKNRTRSDCNITTCSNEAATYRSFFYLESCPGVDSIMCTLV